MNGFLLVDSATGRTLVTVPMEPNMGVPQESGMAGGNNSGDVLAALMYGLHVNAAAAFGLDDDEEESEKARFDNTTVWDLPNMSPLQYYTSPDFTVHVAQVESSSVISCVFMKPCAAVTAVGSKLAEEFLKEFLMTFGEHYHNDAAGGAGAEVTYYKKGFLPIAKELYGRIACEYISNLINKSNNEWCMALYSPELSAGLFGDDAVTANTDAKPKKQKASKGAGIKAHYLCGYAGDEEVLVRRLVMWLYSNARSLQATTEKEVCGHEQTIRVAATLGDVEVHVCRREHFYFIASTKQGNGAALLMGEQSIALMADAFRTVYLSNIPLPRTTVE